MYLRSTDLWIKNYALDLLGCLSLESCIFLGQFRELLFEVAGSEGEVFYILDQRSFDYRLSRIASSYSASLKRLQRPSRKSSRPSVTLVMKSSSSCDFFNGITAFSSQSEHAMLMPFDFIISSAYNYLGFAFRHIISRMLLIFAVSLSTLP